MRVRVGAGDELDGPVRCGWCAAAVGLCRNGEVWSQCVCVCRRVGREGGRGWIEREEATPAESEREASWDGFGALPRAVPALPPPSLQSIYTLSPHSLTPLYIHPTHSHTHIPPYPLLARHQRPAHPRTNRRPIRFPQHTVTPILALPCLALPRLQPHGPNYRNAFTALPPAPCAPTIPTIHHLPPLSTTHHQPLSTSTTLTCQPTRRRAILTPLQPCPECS